MDEDWDLQAVVRSCSRITTTAAATTATTPLTSDSCFSGREEQGSSSHVVCFPDLFEPRNDVVEDLEQLYKPFLPKFQVPITPLANLVTPNPIISQIKQEQDHHHQQQQQLTRRSSTGAASIRPKRRKNQQKKVVCQVPAEGLSSDMWAWRKYGQKPIKGSPYPRGYYRCSSSKGCLARKQVERSRTDPGTFIITYTAEHNHPVPTHRNSLAGSTRHKLTSPQTTTTTTTATIPKPTLSSSPLGLSPITPLTMEEDDEEERLSKGEGEEEEDDDLGISKLQELMSDDLFMELDEFMGPTSSNSLPVPVGVQLQPFDDSFASHWFTSAAPSATAAGGV